jgi:hypothetical protein
MQKIYSTKHFMYNFGMGSKWVCDFPLLKSELVKTGEELDTLFDPVPKLHIKSFCAVFFAF